VPVISDFFSTVMHSRGTTITVVVPASLAASYRRRPVEVLVLSPAAVPPRPD